MYCTVKHIIQITLSFLSMAYNLIVIESLILAISISTYTKVMRGRATLKSFHDFSCWPLAKWLTLSYSYSVGRVRDLVVHFFTLTYLFPSHLYPISFLSVTLLDSIFFLYVCALLARRMLQIAVGDRYLHLHTCLRLSWRTNFYLSSWKDCFQIMFHFLQWKMIYDQ